eukprot:jgi/Hompol1/6199/HPOL_001018-RA
MLLLLRLLLGLPGSTPSIERKIFSQQLIDLSRNGKKKSRVLSGAAKLEFALDAFGCAKTPFGHNTLCFGRYSEYQYASTGRMVGVKLLDYALDKARVSASFALDDGERNFNIFYQLLAGATKQEKDEMHIADHASFAYIKGAKAHRLLTSGGLGSATLSRSNTQSTRRFGTLGRNNTISRKESISRKPLPSTSNTHANTEDAIPTAEDNQMFQDLREHLKSLGIGRRTQNQIYRVLAAILHLGNITFGIDSSVKDDASTIIRNQEALDNAAMLLDLSPKSLSEGLMYRSKLIGRELCSIYLHPEGAAANRDALAETLYSLVFSWLIEHLNTRLCKPDDEVDNFIGLADFPWFRAQFSGHGANFAVFIGNYAQERLVHYTQNCHFDDVDFILKTEGISVVVPSYQDNQWSIDVFRGTPRQKGMISLFDDDSDATNEASAANDLNRAQTILSRFDAGLKSNPHYVPSFKCTITAPATSAVSPTAPTARNLFGIRHYTSEPTVQYDLDDFVDQDISMSDFVALFRGSAALLDTANDSDSRGGTFIAQLFSSRTGVKTVRSGRGVLLGVQKIQGPLRRPSIKRKKADLNTENPSNSAKSQKTSSFAMATESVDDLLSTLKATQHWSVISIAPSESASQPFHPGHVKWQLEQLNILELCQFRAAHDIDASNGMKYTVFAEKYASLLATKGLARSSGSPRELVKQFIATLYWPSREIIFGSSMLFLSQGRWRWIYGAMKRLEPPSQSGTAPGVSELTLAERPVSSSGLPPFGQKGDRPVSFSQPHTIPFGQQQQQQRWQASDDDRSDAESNYESEYSFSESRPSGGMARGNSAKTLDAIEMGKMPASPTSPAAGAGSKKTTGPAKREIVDSVTTVTRARKCWVCCTWSLTWWIPSFMLTCCGMKRPDIRMAWREKVALCIIIAFVCLSLLFFIIGLRFIICPTVSVKSQDEIRQMSTAKFSGARMPWFAASGRYFYANDLMSQHLKDYGPSTGPTALPNYVFEAYYGNDVSNLFYKQDRWTSYCPGIPTPQAGWDYLDPQIDWMKRSAVVDPLAIHRSKDSSGQPIAYLDRLNKYAKGRIGWTADAVKAMSSETKRYVIIFDNVYYVTPVDSLRAGVFSQTVRNLLSTGQGQDISSDWKQKRLSSAANQADLDATLTCLNNMFYIGTVDRRDTFQCRFTDGLLFSTSVVLVVVIGFKFLAALQFGSRKDPEEGDKFVICMVPCYTEGTESLAKTLESLAVLRYDDKRKLIFVICDGMIIGSGNDRPTPRLVLDILGVDPEVDPEPLAFQSLGEGNKQFNMGKVYSGLYEVRGHSVPFVVVVKVGSPSERVKPGNRGKRDSQLVLMRFLNRVHFNAEFAPMEVEIYHHMKNIIGVSPSFYEFILMIDADTEVEPHSLTRMVAVMVHDVRVMGLCGETRISNERDSWVTMIQVYEYFISHHLAKAFESLFGTVTCLPGCFCMYRIRSPAKNAPLLVAPGLLTDYAENSVDTLHMKNLLHLGEDRYLTTLMLKHFPTMRTKFTAEARCWTVVPERWSVLLSQRRRWINSTVHNLFELILLDQLCGFCCFSMRFIVFLDLFATFVQPATVLYIAYLIYASVTSTDVFPLLSIILIACIYGFQIIIFVLKREWQHIAWMIIYILALPIFSFYIPCYAFWHFNDFSWGNTRVVVGDGKKTVYVADAEP